MNNPHPDSDSPEPVVPAIIPVSIGQSQDPTLLERLHRALGPLAAGIIIDVVDFATFGPIGLVLGPVLGGLAGWWVSSLYHFGTRGRLIVALLAALYCTIPFTELLPLATLVAATARFFEGPPSAGDSSSPPEEAQQASE